jgi:two-component system chemotaxis response regulator CheY
MTPKALVLDDSRVMRGILTKILTARGFQTVQASNGLEALEVMERDGSAISLVLADWNMPVMNGLEFVKALRTQARFAHVPVMMVTSETDTEQVVEALTAGANEYIMKPFTAEIVDAKLQLLEIGRR